MYLLLRARQVEELAASLVDREDMEIARMLKSKRFLNFFSERKALQAEARARRELRDDAIATVLAYDDPALVAARAELGPDDFADQIGAEVRDGVCGFLLCDCARAVCSGWTRLF